MPQYFLPIKKLRDKPYSDILGFPKATKRQIESRVCELQKLGVLSVAFVGPIKIGRLSVLGKGYVGIVVLAKIKNKNFALKIRRTDSIRDRMGDEAKLLNIANQVNVGPKLVQSSKNFLIMEFIRGKKIISWISEAKKINSKIIKYVIKQVLVDCFLLDQIGLDHGELSVLNKHVLITNKKPTIIDFESSSIYRKTSNVSSAVQAILIGTGLAKTIRGKIKVPTKNKIIKSVQNYKKMKTQESFDELLAKLKL